MANRKVQPRLSALMHDYLDDLSEIGLYGDSPTEVAKQLIERGVTDAIDKGHIRVRRRRRG